MRIGFGTAVLTALAPARAQVPVSFPVYPWCASYGDGASNCYFSTLDQCWRAALGNGGVCQQNPFYNSASAVNPRVEPTCQQNSFFTFGDAPGSGPICYQSRLSAFVYVYPSYGYGYPGYGYPGYGYPGYGYRAPPGPGGQPGYDVGRYPASPPPRPAAPPPAAGQRPGNERQSTVDPIGCTVPCRS